MTPRAEDRIVHLTILTLAGLSLGGLVAGKVYECPWLTKSGVVLLCALVLGFVVTCLCIVDSW